MTRTHCKRGHEFAQYAVVREGVRICVPCRRLRKRERTRRLAGLAGPALVVAGQSFLSIRLVQAWAVRKEKWPTGISPDGLAQARAKRQRRSAAARTCRRGHRWTDENTVVRANGTRVCRACLTLGAHRHRWAALQEARLEALRQEMLLAHPDKGGTAAKFCAARRRWSQAKAS